MVLLGYIMGKIREYQRQKEEKSRKERIRKGARPF